jgi:hypothetical protein
MVVEEEVSALSATTNKPWLPAFYDPTGAVVFAM